MVTEKQRKARAAFVKKYAKKGKQKKIKRPENLKYMRKFKKYYGKLKPANPAYVYMLNPKNELRSVKKSDTRKYNLGK